MRLPATLGKMAAADHNHLPFYQKKTFSLSGAKRGLSGFLAAYLPGFPGPGDSGLPPFSSPPSAPSCWAFLTFFSEDRHTTKNVKKRYLPLKRGCAATGFFYRQLGEPGPHIKSERGLFSHSHSTVWLQKIHGKPFYSKNAKGEGFRGRTKAPTTQTPCTTRIRTGQPLTSRNAFCLRSLVLLLGHSPIHGHWTLCRRKGQC